MKNVIHCSLCGNNNLRTIFQVKDWLVTEDFFDLVECSICKSRHTSPVPEKEEIYRYYDSNEYRPHNLQRVKMSDLIYRTVRGIMIEKKRKWIQSFSDLKIGRLLDVGSGTGEFAASMKDNGWEVSCVESSDHVRLIAKEKFNLDVVSPDIWLDMDESLFDIITFWHTLEHVGDPRLYLKTAKAQLKEKGTMFIGVPNFTSHDAMVYGENWAAYDVPRHITHFQPSSMEKLFESCNLKLLGIIGLPYDAYYVSMISARNIGKNFIGGLWTGYISNRKAKADRKRFSSLIYAVQSKSIN